MTFFVKLEERRQSVRHRVSRLATIGTGEPRYCLVTDVSSGGVRIRVSGPKVPDEFVLRFPPGDVTGRDGTYKVIWRNGLEIGAMFVSTSLQNRERLRFSDPPK